MGVLHHEEPPNPSKSCKFLKDAFSICHNLCIKISSHNLDEDDDDVSDFDDEQEIFVSAVLSRYMEAKSKRKLGLAIDSFIWDYSPFGSPPAKKDIHLEYDVIDKDEFHSPCSRLSRCSSATTAEEFMSVKTNLSRCSSMSSIEFPVFKRRRSIMRELCHYQGWPFGLCRKALLVPPLPKSPSESWMWRKTPRTVKKP